jgi:hypothetical protein
MNTNAAINWHEAFVNAILWALRGTMILMVFSRNGYHQASFMFMFHRLCPVMGPVIFLHQSPRTAPTQGGGTALQIAKIWHFSVQLSQFQRPKLRVFLLAFRVPTEVKGPEQGWVCSPLTRYRTRQCKGSPKGERKTSVHSPRPISWRSKQKILSANYSGRSRPVTGYATWMTGGTNPNRP